tara:strand:- start:370 stop:546 length:177 start_codon:yes stop_codon:yes gene_type:complete
MTSFMSKISITGMSILIRFIKTEEVTASDTEYIGCRFDFKVGESCDLGQRWKNRKHCE